MAFERNLYNLFMKRNLLIILSSVVGLVLMVYILWSAVQANKTSDNILNDFNKVDNSLKQANDSIKKSNDSLILNLKKKLSQ